MKRKGEIARGQINRDWPHQVLIPDFRGDLWLGRWASICERHHTVAIDDEWHRIYCFSNPEDADNCAETFRPIGAKRINAKDYTRPSGWASFKWRDGVRK